MQSTKVLTFIVQWFAHDQQKVRSSLKYRSSFSQLPYIAGGSKRLHGNQCFECSESWQLLRGTQSEKYMITDRT